MPSRIQRELALLLTGKDVSWSKATKGAERSVARLHTASAKAGANMARNLERAGIIAGTAFVGAIGYAVNQAIDRESAIAGVAKTIEGDVSGIVAGLDEITSRTPTKFTELAAIAEAAGALGVAESDIVSFTETVAILGETTDLTSDAAADSLGHLRTTLKLTGKDYSEVADILVHLGNNGASTESQILGMAEQVAGAAGILDASKEDVLAWSAAIANTGEEAEAGGSAIQRFWLGSFKHVAKGGKALKLMAKTTGMTAEAFKDAFGKDAAGTLAKFITKLGKLSEAEQIATLEALGFTDIRITRSLLKLLANTENLTQSYEDVKAAEKAANEEAAKRFGTTEAVIATLKNNIDLAAAAIGNELLPMIRDLSNEGIDWLQDNKGEIREFGRDLANGIQDAVDAGKSLDWAAIGTALKLGGQGAKAIVDAFANLPPEAQATIAALTALNKFTGGAVIDFGKIAFDQFAGRGANPANPVWVAPVGGGLTPGGSPTTTPGGGKPGGSKPGGSPIPPLGTLLGLLAISQAIGPDMPRGGQEAHDAAYIATLKTMYSQGRGNEVVASSTGETVIQALNRLGVRVSSAIQAGPPQQQAEQRRQTAIQRALGAQEQRRGERLVQTGEQQKAAIDASKARLAAEQATTRRENTRGYAFVAAAERATAAAIRAKDLSVRVTIQNTVKVSVRDMLPKTTFQQRAAEYG